MKPFLLFLFLITFPQQIFPQKQSEADSLIIELETVKDDTLKAELLYKIAWALKYSDPQRATTYAEEGLNLAQTLGWKRGEGNLLNTLGVIYDIKAEYHLALNYYFKALKAKVEIGNKREESFTLNNIGIVYRNLSDFPKALEYFEKSMVIKKGLKDQKGIASSLNNIGLVNKSLGEYDKALKNYKASLKIKEALDDQSGIAITLNNIGIIYESKNDLAKALEAYEKSLKIGEALGDKRVIAHLLGNLGNTNLLMKDYPIALDYGFKSLELNNEIGDKQGAILAINSIATVYNQSGKYKQAKEYAIKSIDLSSGSGLLAEKTAALGLLTDVYKKTNEFEKAFEYQDLFLASKDSLEKTQNQKEIDRLGMLKEFEKQQLFETLSYEKKLNKEQIQKRTFLFIGLGVLLFALSLWARLSYVRNSRAKIQKEKDRSDYLLLNILPTDVAEELKDKGEAEAKYFDEATILFTDFKGFTKISEQLSPKDLVSEINHCFKAFDEIISGYKIEKIKTIGDAYMAAGGLQVPRTTSASDVVKAALEMQDFILKRNKRRKSEGKTAFEMRVGVHSGPVVAGIVGVKKFQYDIWGDTVNIASRIEDSGEVGKVNISQDTFELIKEDPELRFNFRGRIQAKNKGELEMYFVEKK